MIETISQMPISPWKDPEIGYYGQLNQASGISKIVDKPYILASNVLGSKTGHQQDILEQMDYLNKAGIKYDDLWLDQDIQNIKYTELIIQQGIKEGWIEHQKRETFLCPCGKTEFLNTEENLHPSQERTTYQIDGTSIVCKLCKGQAILSERDVLVMKLPNMSVPYVDVYPKYAKSEIEQVLKFFSGKECLISRNSQKLNSVRVDGSEYWIDMDINWLPFMHNLQVNNNYKIDILLTGNRTLKQTALALMFNKILGAQLPSLIISTPHIKVDFGEKPKLKANYFLKQNGSDVTKIFLAQSLGANDKTVIFESKGIYWISKSLEGYVRHEMIPEIIPNLKDFLNPKNKEILGNALKKLRSHKEDEITNYEKTLLWAFTED